MGEGLGEGGRTVGSLRNRILHGGPFRTDRQNIGAMIGMLPIEAW